MSTREYMAAVNQPVRGNITRGADRILDMPRCWINFNSEVPHGGGVAANAAYSTSGVAYDTDGMTAGGTPFIRCKTAGLYMVSAQSSWSGGGGPASVWTRIITNNSTAAANVIGQTTESRDLSGWSGTFSTPGMWLANAGDTLSLYQFSDIAVNLTDQSIAVCLISL